MRICNLKFKLIILSPCWWPVSVQASSWHEPIDVKLMFIMPVIPRENYLLRIVTLLRQPLYKPYLFGACLYAFAQWSKTLYGNRYFYFVSLYLKLLKRFYMYSLSSSWLSRGFRSPYHPYHCLIFWIQTAPRQNLTEAVFLSNRKSAVLNFCLLTSFFFCKMKTVNTHFSAKSSWEVHWIVMFQKDAVCSAVWE